MTLKTIDPRTVAQRLAEGSAVLIDIREPDEYAREHIPGARSVPLSAIDAQDFEHDKIVVFQCKSGARTVANAQRLSAKPCREAYALAGGLDAWKAAGLGTEINRRAPIDLQRQVQIGAGFLALTGVVLGLAVSIWFLLLSAFVGAGLMTAGITGFCGMARILARMPWNRRHLALPS
jgi:rhodanese-related sulfurtransferase